MSYKCRLDSYSFNAVGVQLSDAIYSPSRHTGKGRYPEGYGEAGSMEFIQIP